MTNNINDRRIFGIISHPDAGKTTLTEKLLLHGGGLETVSLMEGRYTFRLTGQCAGCPSAYLTTEELIRGTLLERFPQLREVVLEQGVSADLLAQARSLLRHE